MTKIVSIITGIIEGVIDSRTNLSPKTCDLITEGVEKQLKKRGLCIATTEIVDINDRLANKLRYAHAEIAHLKKPIDVILNCPQCGERHIDEGDWGHKEHHTHACQSCGFVW